MSELPAEKPAVEAVRAMRARGIDNAEALLEFADPEAILAACRWFDGRKGVGPGLLAKKIREGGIEAKEDPEKIAKRKEEQFRALFSEYTRRFPHGSVTETHARMQARRWPDLPAHDDPDPDAHVPSYCSGDLVVTTTIYPVVEVRCDTCGFEAAYPVRAHGVLPLAPIATGRPEPPPRPAQPAPTNPKGRRGGLHRPGLAGAFPVLASEFAAAPSEHGAEGEQP